MTYALLIGFFVAAVIEAWIVGYKLGYKDGFEDGKDWQRYEGGGAP